MRKACIPIAALAAVALLAACDSAKRHAVLSFFFDGVPPLPQAVEGTSRDKTAGEAAAAGKRAFFQHGPYAARLCEACHEPRTNRLVMPREELCGFCHVLTRRPRKVHGPLSSGGCNVCHDPHGSPNRFLLVSASDDFCFTCHDRQDVLKREVHQAAEETCTACHDAHGGDDQFLLKPQRPRSGREAGPAP